MLRASYARHTIVHQTLLATLQFPPGGLGPCEMVWFSVLPARSIALPASGGVLCDGLLDRADGPARTARLFPSRPRDPRQR